jgi:hypothetical protein
MYLINFLKDFLLLKISMNYSSYLIECNQLALAF